MAKANALELYKSGIGRIHALEDPFRTEDEQSDSIPQITSGHSPAVIRTNRFLYVAAVACIVFITIAAIGYVRSRDIEITDQSSYGGLHESSDHNVISTSSSATTSQPAVTTAESSLTVTSSMTSSSSQTEIKMDYSTVYEAVTAYRSCEDEIQLTLKDFKAARAQKDFSSEKLNEYQEKLNKLTQMQSTITNYIININKKLNRTSDIIILDARMVDNTDKPTVKLVIINLLDYPITLQGSGALLDFQTGEQVGTFNLSSSINIPNQGSRSTIYFDASGIPSEITQKVSSDKKKYSVSFSAEKLSESGNGYEKIPITISAASWFETEIKAMSYLEEDALYKRDDFENLGVINN